MTTKHLLIFCAFWGIITSPLRAQQHAYEWKPCGTAQVMQEVFRKNPQLAEQWKTRTKAPMPAAPMAMEDSVLVIPVVVHIIHNYGIENVSNAQVFDMMRIINEDFAKVSSDTGQIDPFFKPIVGKGKVEFRLAQKDPDGNCTIGITRTVSTLTNSADDNVKDLIGWNTSQYFNIWVVRNISFGAGAYAYYPGTINAEYEGVVCLASQFGSIGASSSSNFSARTMTHEIGHYFNLAHTWGDSNEPGSPDNCLWDDDVEDTPNTAGVSNQGCNKNMMSCGVKSNVENYMDYSNCGRMFTQGQVARMRTALFSSIADRNQLWTLENRIATGVNNGYTAVCAPLADFATNFTTVCSGKPVIFTPQIGNVLNTSNLNYVWTFSGATPATSAESNPSVVYPQVGTYAVKLKVFNAAGADSVTKQGLIRVNAGTAVYSTALGVTEDFETTSFPVFAGQPNKEWVAEPALSWKRSTFAANTGVASAAIDNRFLPDQTVSNLVTPAFDVSSVTGSAVLSFDLAFARTSSTNRDILSLQVSSDCGRNWLPLQYSKVAISTSNPLSTVGNTFYTGIFVPTAQQWRRELVNISNYGSYNNVRFRFKMTSRGGNFLYIDNVKIITQPVTSLDETNETHKIRVSPNPFEDVLQLTHELTDNNQIQEIMMLNTLGQTMKTYNISPSENKEIVLPTSQLSAGVYWLKIVTNKQQIFRKVVKQ
jgi:PKD repeat protein